MMLQGIKVVDLTSVVFGPYATQILADLGAEVIKVESPAGGDGYRWSAKSPKTPGMSPGFMTINRGKQSVALDLKTDEARTAMQALLADADVFVVNVRGKALERLGLDYDAVKAIKPDIIYVHCVGFGQDGPYADLQAYDDVIQAASGTTTLLGRVDGGGEPRYIPSLIADKVAGLHGAYATLAALFHRERTGEGQLVEVPMFEAFSNFMLLEHMAGLTFDPPVGDVGYARQLDPYRQPFPTADGHISIVAYTDEAWPRVFEMLEDPEFLAQERFATRKGRVIHQDDLYQKMAELTPNFTTETLMERCRALQLPAQPVRDLADMLSEPHLTATGFFQRREHPTEGGYVAMTHPVKFGAGKVGAEGPPPNLGQDTEATLAALKAKG